MGIFSKNTKYHCAICRKKIPSSDLPYCTMKLLHIVLLVTCLKCMNEAQQHVQFNNIMRYYQDDGVVLNE